ncbi:putative uncharacterized protein [Roseburia sp. CAG:309]|nr:putative uncharacterized protein [Roseburia sp. CAG:309]
MMERWKGTKCQFGYINKQKKFQFAMLMLYVLIGVGLFLIGLAVHKTQANLFTVLGILMVLPAAKRVIALVLMVPRKSVGKERFEKVQEALPESAAILTDYVFTSTEKVMSLDFVIVMNKNVYGIKDQKKTDDAYVEKYLSETISAGARGYRVQLFENDDAFLAMLKRSERKETAPEERPVQDKIVHDLTIIAV